MLRLFRSVLSVFIAIELLFASLISGGKLRVELPRYEPAGNGRYVNAFIGTGGIPWMCGMLSPAAAAPFGCVRLGPDTCAAGGLAAVKTNTSGYYYEHRHMLGFSLGRLSGTGARDYGMFRVTPQAGLQLNARPTAPAYSHEGETASPGYYAVYLPGAAALCEMTASSHVGLQRYTFTTEKNAGLYLDASSCLSGGSAGDTRLSVDPGSNSLTAQTTLYETFSGRYGGLTAYLYADWDAPEREAVLNKDGGGVLLDFGTVKDKAVTLRAAVSFVSCENAKENLMREVGSDGFDAVREKTAALWSDRLSAIEIGADDETKEIFYTALYHAMQMPTDFTDANGEYLGFDGEVHRAEDFTYRTDLSL